MRVLISGSRDFKNLDLVKNFVKLLPDDTILLNGKARGVDNVARNQGKFQGLDVRDYEADWKKYGKSAGIIRNHVMANIAEMVFCFCDRLSPGTQDVIDYTLSLNKPLYIFYEGGEMDYFNV